jgi:hypothetical protein
MRSSAHLLLTLLSPQPVTQLYLLLPYERLLFIALHSKYPQSKQKAVTE